MTISCILAPPAGSKWYFNYSYTCGNTCIGLIYASFDPSLEIVSVREIFKNLYPNGPSDEIFFCVHTNMSISSLWLVYKDSKWSGKDPGGFSYILGPILPNLIFRQYLGGGQNSRFGGENLIGGSKVGNLIL